MNITSDQIQTILPTLDKEICDFVSMIMPKIPLDDDFKLRAYASIEPSRRVQFLEEQYNLSVTFSSIFKKQLSRILKRNVSDDIDFLFQNSYLRNEAFILANTVTQFRILTSLLTQKHNVIIYDHESRLPAELKDEQCCMCGGKLLSRSFGTNDNNQGWVVAADQHYFHYSCLSFRLANTPKCSLCNKLIDTQELDSMSPEEKNVAFKGLNFLAGGKKQSRRKKNVYR
jgi:hypothetical protein